MHGEFYAREICTEGAQQWLSNIYIQFQEEREVPFAIGLTHVTNINIIIEEIF